MSYLLTLALGVAIGRVIPRPQWYTDLLAKVKSMMGSDE